MADYDEERIARRLRAAMVEFNLDDYKALAKLIGIAGPKSGRVNNWVNGKNRPMVPEMARLCDETGITLDWLYRGKVTPIDETLGRSLNRRDAAAEHPAGFTPRWAPDISKPSKKAKKLEARLRIIKG